MADGARVVAFVYAPAGTSGEPGTPFGVARTPAPVVVLHGNGEDHEHMLGLIGPLSRKRSVIAIDTRGHGASTRGTAPLDYDLIASDVLEVMSRLGVTQAHVLGFSDGGIVGLLLALNAPHRVLGLVTLGANLTPEGLVPEVAGDMRRGLRELESAGQGGPGRGPRYTNAELLRLMLEHPHIDAASLAVVRCPTCVMAGEHDLIRYEETHTIAGAITGARQVTVAGAGHDLPLDAPTAVCREALKTFAAGEMPLRPREFVMRDGDGDLCVVGQPLGPAGWLVGEVAVIPARQDDESAVQAVYDHLLDACDEPGRETCGWKRDLWPLPDDVARRLREGTTWLAARKCDIEGLDDGVLALREGAAALGAMSLDHDLGLPGVDVGWEALPKEGALTCHLLATDPAARRGGVATALMAAYAVEAIRHGCVALRINTSPQSLSNRLYLELGFVPHKPVWFPYEGLPLTGWTNVYELRLDRVGAGGAPVGRGDDGCLGGVSAGECA